MILLGQALIVIKLLLFYNVVSQTFINCKVTRVLFCANTPLVGDITRLGSHRHYTIQIPVVTVKVSERGAALNHVRWSADGRRLVVGDLEGQSYVYEVGEVRYRYFGRVKSH